MLITGAFFIVVLTRTFSPALNTAQVVTIKFLHGYDKPVIALIHEDTKYHRHLKTYELLLREKEIKDGPFSQDSLEPGVSLIIPVPKPWCGLILVGEQTIAYHNGRDIQTVAVNTAGIRAMGKVDADGSRCACSSGDERIWLCLALVVNGRACAFCSSNNYRSLNTLY